MLSRRHFLLSSATALLASRPLLAEAPMPAIMVYKDPSCDCCMKWVKYMSAHGFVVSAQDVDNIDQVKQNLHVPKAVQSCHTAVVGQYLIEGHVPADLVKKLLTDKPATLGLAVPGMVVGSPGMEGARSEHYDVLAFSQDGKTRVYAKR